MFGDDLDCDDLDQIDEEEEGSVVPIGHETNVCGGLTTWDWPDAESMNTDASATIIERDAPDSDDAEYYVYDAAGQRVRKVKETFESGETVKRVVEKIYLGSIQLRPREPSPLAALADPR